VYSHFNLARIADKEKNVKAAIRYYSVVQDKAEKKSEYYREARAYLKKNKQ
jgi:hypothetical protein